MSRFVLSRLTDSEGAFAVQPESDGVKTMTVTVAQAWAVLSKAVDAAQPTGEIVIASGKGTNLFLRVKASDLPAEIALDLIEQGIRKPLTDISLDKATDEGNWHLAHGRRLKRIESWKAGVFSQRGGAGDEVGSQMKIELTEELKSKGLSVKSHPEFFKGNFSQMVDALDAKGLVKDREHLVTRMKDAAVAKLAARGKATESVDLSGISL